MSPVIFNFRFKSNTQEYLSFPEKYNQQARSGKLLILSKFTLNSSDYNVNKPVLFCRIGETDDELLLRFRENIWYESKKYEMDIHTITIYSFNEYIDIWQLIEKRINVVAILISTIISSIVTILTLQLNNFQKENQYSNTIENIQKKIQAIEEKQNN
ncbi:hypothetical protein AB3N60_11335 [Leptospira sp. WS39.C2]